MSGEEEAGALEGLSGYDHIRLTVSSTMYTVARALRVNKVKDRLGPSHIVPSKPLWMLGKRYDIEGGEPLQQHKVCKS